MIVGVLVVLGVVFLVWLASATRRHPALEEPGWGPPPRRLADDGNYLVELRAAWPEGYEVFESSVQVRGTSREPFRSRIESLAWHVGPDTTTHLLREPANPHDANAVQVVAAWTERGRRREECVGYLPAEIAARLAGDPGFDEIAVGLRTLYRPRPDMNAGARVDLGRPRPPDPPAQEKRKRRRTKKSELPTAPHDEASGRSESGRGDPPAGS